MKTVKQTTEYAVENPDDPNVRDPEHAHELGGTLGMTIGGVAGGIAAGAAAGAGIGSAAGPLGVVAGAAIGGAIGGITGESIAREVNPTAEEAYWEENYLERPYVTKTRGYDSYRPAYRYGVEAYQKHQTANRSFDDLEPTIRNDWGAARGTSSLEWDEAKPAARDAYDRLKNQRG